MKTIMVTGGAGFIGSAVCRELVTSTPHACVNVDKLSYASSTSSLATIENSPRYRFHQVDICDGAAISRILEEERIDAILHLAAESHVDRSIDGPAPFISTNIMGTYTLLESARAYWDTLTGRRHGEFRFLHVSTDEVFGSLGPDGSFTEETAYDPSSPYSASKAAADHLVRAWHRTYGLPVLLTNCSNNYGPYQFPEKLIPLSIANALEGKDVGVYGSGANVRDWLHVEDHARALLCVLSGGSVGQSYNVGSLSERSNLQVVRKICDLLDELRPAPCGTPHNELIRFVADRPGHDFRYAIDPTRIQRELGYRASLDFEAGLRQTVTWYIENEWWWKPLRESSYRGERLGRAALASA